MKRFVRSFLPTQPLLFAALLVSSLGFAPALTGCAVSKDDVTRWEGTLHGPEKLVAVVTHDKYRLELRKEAILSLIRMPARGGARQGIKLLLDKHKDSNGEDLEGALLAIPEDTRAKLLELLTPDLIAELAKAPPAKVDGRAAPDPSIPYKDITYAMLTHEPPIVTKRETKDKLEAALVQWSQTGFEDRLENSSQQFGLEQMMRSLGSRTATKLPALINENTYRVDRIVGLIAEIGDTETKQKGSEELVKLSKRIESNDWIDGQKKRVDEYNKANVKTPVTADQVAVQVGKIQDRKLSEEIFPAMRKLGLKPVSDYLYDVAADSKRPEERRKLALAALEGKPDKNNPKDLERLFSIAKEENTPDGVRDLAFARLGELPKDQILPRLYTLFEQPKKWKVRWVAASLILRSIGTKQVADFMAHLPKTNKVKIGMTEGLSYGGLIAKMEPAAGEPKTRDAIMPFLTETAPFGAKMAAIGYFYEGKKADAALLQKFVDDKDPIAKCEKEDDCQWACGVAKSPATPNDRDVKEIATVGELVKLCVIPSMDK
jgi:hypothetical protein